MENIVINFTKHAKQRAKERKILKSEIEKALLNPAKITKIEINKFICYHKFGDTKTLAVVFIKQRQFYKIITLYWL